MPADVRRQRWDELEELLTRVERGGLVRLSVPEVKRLGQLYRQVTIDLSKARGAEAHPDLIRYLNALASRAHGQVYRSAPVNVRPALWFLAVGFPRLFRRHAIAMSVAFGIFLASSVVSAVAVVLEPSLAYSLFDPDVVQFENLRLENLTGEYKGNFTFGMSQSSFMGLIIIANNVMVALRMFAFGALLGLPCLLILVYNGRMFGTFEGLVYNGGQFVAFNSLVLTHGVLELSAICIAGGAGLLIGWAVIAPGRRTRRTALRATAVDALGLFGGSVVMLVTAGIIEAYVTPHFPAEVRWSVAAVSGLLLVAYLGWAGREKAA